MLTPACSPSAWKVEAGGSQIQGHPRLYRKVQTSLIAVEIVSPAPHRKALEAVALELSSPCITFYFILPVQTKDVPPLEFSFNVFQTVP